MPSPDIREFVDLTLYDLESQSVYLAALDYMRVAMPEFRPVEGSIETVLMQAVAVEVAELVRSINRLPGGVLQALLRLFEVERLDGTSPSAIVRINGATSSQAEIPIGTRFFYQPQLDAVPLVLETDATVVLTHTKNIASAAIDEFDPTKIVVNTATPHGFPVGMTVTFDGPTMFPTNYGPWTISGVSSLTSFTISDFAGMEEADWSTVTVTPDASHPATGFVNATGTTITDEFNGITAGTELDMLSNVPQAASIFLATNVSGGRNTESDAEYFARATANLARANLSLVTADNYTQWMLNGSGFSDVYRATTLDSTDGYRDETPGSVLVIVAPVDAGADNLIGGLGNGTITPADPEWGDKDEIRLAAKEISHPNLEVYISDPVIVYVKVDVSVSPETGKTGVEVSNAVQGVLNEYISPNTWDWSTFVRRNDLIARIYNTEDAEGERVVKFVQSVSISVEDIYIPPNNYYTTEAAITSYTYDSMTNTGTVVLPVDVTMDVANSNYAALRSSEGWFVFPVTAITPPNTFVVDLGESTVVDGFFEWYHVGYNTPLATSNADLVVLDPAPLMASGSHEVTIV